MPVLYHNRSSNSNKNNNKSNQRLVVQKKAVSRSPSPREAVPASQLARYQSSMIFNNSLSEYCVLSDIQKDRSSNRLSAVEARDLYEYLSPHPCFPPDYRDVNVSPNHSFPIYEAGGSYDYSRGSQRGAASAGGELPGYSPAVYQYTLILKKNEWNSPYESSTGRSWRNYIMEINSTQLNFYALDNLPILSKIKKASKTKNYYEFSTIEFEFIMNEINKNPAKFINSKTLVSSFSLQFTKFGLPADYKKKNNCLRLRIEAEQILLHFNSIDDMLNWSNYLSTGINVSLDLDLRELPKDRTVPRRRRNRDRNGTRGRSSSHSHCRHGHSHSHSHRRSSHVHSHHSYFSDGYGYDEYTGSGRARSYSDSELIRRELVQKHENKPSFNNNSISIKSRLSSIFRRNSSSASAADVALPKIAEKSSSSVVVEDEEAQTEAEADAEAQDEADAEEADSDDELTSLFNDFSLSPSPSTNSLSSTELKLKQWKPDYKTITRKKFLKDSLRCIKILTTEESWIGDCIILKNHSKSNLQTFIVGPQGYLLTAN